MCGIFGYCNYCVSKPLGSLVGNLITGLRRLEYRGYDSAGVCVDTPDGKPVIVKRAGNVQVLHEAAVDGNVAKLDMDAVLQNTSGIAHTRWATHGPPCDKNAHPQASAEDLEFTVVHNGIMTNYLDMKQYLVGKGRAFVSDTDTEVIAGLFSHLYAQQPSITFPRLMMEVMTMTNGAFALAVKSVHFPGELCAAKRGAPLVVGIKRPAHKDPSATPPPESPAAAETPTSEMGHRRSTSIGDEWDDRVLGAPNRPGEPVEVFVASDTAPLIEHTKQVMFCDDNDIVHVERGKVHIFNAMRMLKEGGKKMASEIRVLTQIETELESLTKGKFPHYMLKEIYEQVETVVGSMRGRLDFQTSKVKLGGFSREKARFLYSARRFVFISCGTSLNACMAVRPLFDELAPCPIMVENASDFLDRKPKIFRDDVCIFVSQSGETADTLRAMEHCQTNGAVLVGFTNTVGSTISRSTDFGAHLNCGPEIGVASTKAFTSQIVCLCLFALLMAEDSIELQKRRNEIIEQLSTLSANVAQTLAASDEPIKKLALQLAQAKSLLVLGRGYQYPTAMEAALKVKELTYIHTEGINAGELKHGPLALIDEHIPVVIICTKDAIIERVRSAVQQIKARNGRPVVVLSESDPELEALAETVIRVPQTVDCLQSVINVIPMQLLAYRVAVARGNNVDCPRNLAKSVTTE